MSDDVSDKNYLIIKEKKKKKYLPLNGAVALPLLREIQQYQKKQ
jgi:hypothetical protein